MIGVIAPAVQAKYAFTLRSGDLVDQIVSRLKGIGADTAGYLVFAPGGRRGMTPLAVTAMDNAFHQFFDDLRESFEDSSYWSKNVHYTVAYVYEFGLVCSVDLSFGFGTPFVDVWSACYPGISRGEAILVPAPAYSVDALSAKTVIDRILASNDATSGARLFELSKVFKRAIGAHLFGFRDSGARYGNPHDDTPAGQEPANSFINFMVRLIGWLKDDSTEAGTPHEWEITTVFCKPNPAHNPSHCTVENVWCWLKKYPAPVAKNEGKTVADGADLTLVGDNPVEVDVDDATRTLHNVTEDGHIFHNPAQTGCPHRPGTPAQPVTTRCAQTRRQVVKRADGTIVIETDGQGAGPYPEVNDALGPYKFRKVDRDMLLRAKVPERFVYTGETIVVPGGPGAVVRECEDDPTT